MLKLLERTVATLQDRLVVVAPAHVQSGTPFRNVVFDTDRRASLLREVQRLRGSVYFEDGAIEEHQLSADGLHHTSEDERSWHLLFLNAEGKVTASIWYLVQGDSPSFDQLRVRSTPLNHAEPWRSKLSNAVHGELAKARREGLIYAEVGGWAVASESRCTSAGLLLALGGYSLGQVLGGALAMTTATVRHASSSILRRLGGSLLESDGEAIPPYYDPEYRCVMELLRFDTRLPNAKYAGLVERLCEKLIDVPVIAALHACHEHFQEPLAGAALTAA